MGTSAQKTQGFKEHLAKLNIHCLFILKKLINKENFDLKKKSHIANIILNILNKQMLSPKTEEGQRCLFSQLLHNTEGF